MGRIGLSSCGASAMDYSSLWRGSWGSERMMEMGGCFGCDMDIRCWLLSLAEQCSARKPYRRVSRLLRLCSFSAYRYPCRYFGLLSQYEVGSGPCAGCHFQYAMGDAVRTVVYEKKKPLGNGVQIWRAGLPVLTFCSLSCGVYV